jgi:hypothetical protein
MRNPTKPVLIVLVVAVILIGCSSGGNNTFPVVPDGDNSIPEISGTSDAYNASEGNSHYLLAYGLICVDVENPCGPKIEIIPVREGEIHLNILKFLEGAPCYGCFTIAGFEFPQPGILNVDIRVDHPFGNLLYSVFDVRGIIMFQGSHEFPVAGKSISDQALGDGALLNADGYTALYNGSTITAPVGDLQKYYAGKLSTPTIPNSDINGYKYFITDDLANNRNAFFAGSTDTQTFSLKLPTGPFVLGYAVDANWWTPISEPVDDPLIDFGINANCPEPWKIVVTEEPIGQGLTDQGGQTKLLIDVYDWQGKETHFDPTVECPNLFNGSLPAAWVGDEIDYSSYEITLTNSKLAAVGNYYCLVAVEANENDNVNKPWLDLTAYQITALAVTSGISGTGKLTWAKSVTGAPDFDYGNGITTLSDDSLVITGFFRLSGTFGPGETNQTILTGAGGGDVFVARYDQYGSLIWAKRAGGPDFDGAHGIATLSDDSVVVTGEYQGPAIFGHGEPNEIVLTYFDYYDIFIARYNPDGTLAWVKCGGGPDFDYSNGITALSDNSTVVTGNFRNSATFGAGEPNETVLASAGGWDIFIACYNPDGSLAWAKSAGGILLDQGNGITALSDNSTILTGRFDESAIFGQGEPNETVLTSAGEYDIFTARYNPDGTLAWAKSAGGTDVEDMGNGITSLSDNSAVITGTFVGPATFGAGEPNETVLTSDFSTEIFIARYGPDGTFAWVKRAGGAFFDDGYGITTLSDDSIGVTGGFSGSATFGAGDPNQTILTSPNGPGWDIFVARYKSDGSLIWVKGAGSTSEHYDQGYGITALSDNSTAVTGFFSGTATFGLGEENEILLTSSGYTDIFIARFAP